MIVEETIKARAIQLLTPYRFDIMAKYIYALQRVKGINSEWAENVYKEHLHIWNNFFEISPRKEGFEEYKKTFDHLIDTLGKTGFKAEQSVIPIAYNGSPLNGAHRIAASIAHDLEVDCYLTDDKLAGQLDCSYYFFATRRVYVPTGMTIPLSDPLALQYARLKPNCRLICLFSHTVTKEPEIDEIIMKYGLPVYEKRFNLGEHGRVNLMRELYKGEEWVKDRSSYFHGARIKASRCFAKGEHMRVMLFDPQSNADLVRMKAEIRALFDVGKDSVHINDTHEETIRLGEIFFNNNTLVSSNNFHATDRDKLTQAVRRLKRVCRRQGIDTDSVCIAGPAVLASYGVHDSGEIQLITQFDSPDGYKNINDLVDQTELKRTEVVYDPVNFLYFDGMKVLTLPNAEIINKKKRELDKKVILSSEIRDNRSATVYAEANEDCGAVIIWPQALTLGLDEQVVDDLSKVVDIVYRTDVELSPKGGKNLLMQIHDGKPWWEKEIDNEAPKRFKGSTLHFILFKYKNIADLRKWKKDFREELGLGKVIFHLSDPDCEKHIGIQCDCKPDVKQFHNETLKHVHLLLNSNSLKFLEDATPCRLEKFDHHFKLFKSWLKDKKINPQDCCIDNGTVLAAYGLRDSHDLDFLYSGHFIDTGIPGVDCHNFFYQEIKEQLNLELDKDEIINNPEHHFYYKGIKFYNLEILEQIKRDRLVNGARREKDERDYKLIQELKNASETKNS